MPSTFSSMAHSQESSSPASYGPQDRKLDQRRLRELANFFQPYDMAARRGGGSGGARAAHRGGTRITIRLPSRGKWLAGACG